MKTTDARIDGRRQSTIAGTLVSALQHSWANCLIVRLRKMLFITVFVVSLFSRVSFLFVVCYKCLCLHMLNDSIIIGLGRLVFPNVSHHTCFSRMGITCYTNTIPYCYFTTFLPHFYHELSKIDCEITQNMIVFRKTPPPLFYCFSRIKLNKGGEDEEYEEHTKLFQTILTVPRQECFSFPILCIYISHI